MSYQFEDESALEELLNQQLDRQRQRQTKPSYQSTAKPALASLPPSRRPATASSSRQDVPDEAAQVSYSSQQPAKGKLAGWLNSSKASRQPLDDESATGESTPAETVPPPAGSARPPLKSSNARIRDSVLDEILREEKLQELSKQGLIQLIKSQVLPVLRELQSESASPEKLQRLKQDLKEEQEKSRSLAERHSIELRDQEARWQQVQKQMEARLEIQEREMEALGERHKAHLSRLEAEHSEQLSKLAASYQNRMAEEREQLETSLRRRDEYHQLELESKLKVNCDLLRLEAIFGDWQRMVESTIRELEAQFKSVSGLLDKQALDINGSNLELAKKSGQLVEQYEKWEEKGDQLSRLAVQLNELLPKFSSLQVSNESIAKRTGAQLDELMRRNEELRAQELELAKMKEALEAQREQLSAERFQLGLDSNRLAYKDQRASELIARNEQSEQKLAQERQVQVEQAAQLEALRASLELRSKEAKEENQELHLRRRKLLEGEQELREAQVKLERGRKWLAERRSLLEREVAKSARASEQSRKEAAQLLRLQKSLVCSLCLECLFPDACTDNKWLTQVQGDPQVASAALKGASQGRGGPLARLDLDRELARLKGQSRLDEQQLKAESKYVELLSVDGCC